MNYIELFKKYSWVIDMFLLLMFAYLMASFTSTYIRTRLFIIPSVKQASSSNGSNTPLVAIKKDQAYYTTIVERNIFNSSAQGFTELMSNSNGPITKTNMSIKLLGTVAGSPEYAYAVMQMGTDINVYRVKDHINGAIILSIERKKVIILHNGAKEEISMSKRKALEGGGSAGNSGTGIKQIAQNSYTIPESQFQSNLQNMGQLLTQARVVPNVVSGQIDGYRIFAISPGSLYSNIGLQNGDVIHSVNGIRVTTPESALQLFQQLKNERRFDIVIDRNGQQMNLNYAVQ